MELTGQVLQIGYISVIVLIGLWATWRINRSLRRSATARHRELDAKQPAELEPARSTVAPFSKAAAASKKRGAESIEERFTVHRRLLLPLVMLATATLASLPFLGALPATMVSVVAGAVALVIGVAARPMLENAIAGLMMSMSNVVRVGDTVLIGNDYYGTVEDITMTHTTVKLWDWRRYVTPNSEMLQSSVVNYSLYDQYLWACVEFRVSPEADLEEVRRLAVQAASQAPQLVSSEDPEMWIMELEKESVCCWLVGWTRNPSDAWLFKNYVRGRLQKLFRDHGIATHTHRVASAEDLVQGIRGKTRPS
ncbi:MAG: mechanosensitive ion channel family protein [Myxococcota bacterium]